MTDILKEMRDGICVIMLNNPDKLNALDLVMREHLYEVLADVALDSEVRAVVITGAGKAFCAGGDINTMAQVPGGVARKRQQKLQRVCRTITNMDKPVIAAVNGAAAGAGLCVAMACDFIISSERAKYIQSFIKLGGVSDCAGIYTMVRRIGPQKAKDICLTARPVGAQEAMEIGLVDQLVPGEQLMETAMAMASELAGKAYPAAALIKQLINQSTQVGMEEFMIQEAMAAGLALSSDDFAEGVEAFLQKRPPEFKGEPA